MGIQVAVADWSRRHIQTEVGVTKTISRGKEGIADLVVRSREYQIIPLYIY